MIQENQIYYGVTTVGTARIRKEGLYYQFDCRCDFPDDRVHILQAYCNGNNVYLGVCVPIGEHFGITTKIPISKLGDGQIQITASRKENGCSSMIDPEKPFKRIIDIDRAILGDGGIIIKG